MSKEGGVHNWVCSFKGAKQTCMTNIEHWWPANPFFDKHVCSAILNQTLWLKNPLLITFGLYTVWICWWIVAAEYCLALQNCHRVTNKTQKINKRTYHLASATAPCRLISALVCKRAVTLPLLLPALRAIGGYFPNDSRNWLYQ